LFNKEAKHVFIVIKEKGGNEIWVDPVLGEFDGRDPSPYYIKDKKPKNMALERISGIDPKDYITSQTVVRRSDLRDSMGCNCQASSLSPSQINGFDIATFIQQNPLQSLLIGGVAGFIIYKLIA
jgi:hypothetical protein